jgi:ribulose kinase
MCIRITNSTLTQSDEVKYFVGIEVGSGSARAGIFGERGRMAAAASRNIQIWRPAPDHVEQSSDDIWRACGAATRAALKSAGLAPGAIKGSGFDATCSLAGTSRSR